MLRTLRVLAPVAILALAAATGWTWQNWQRSQENAAFIHQRAALLESENQRLRAQLAQTENAPRSSKQSARRHEIEQATAEIRGLSFQQPVTYAVVTRAGIHQMLEQKLHNSYSDADFQRTATSLAAFGLLPEHYPLQEKYLALLSEQVAAFYDQHERKLYMFQDASLDNAQNRMILSHELTHALQDQNFHLLKLPLEVKNDDDLALATSALIEGDATVEMSQYMAGQATVGNILQTLSGAITQDMSQIGEAPRYLREELLAPYIQGQRFVLALMAEGGWPAVSQAFQNPPKSTAQILHPEKYLANPQWQPTRIEWPDTTFNGQKPLDDNVLGELGIRILLSEYTDDATGEKAAQGWCGDRYLDFDGGKLLVWKTAWDSPETTRRFADALTRAWTRRIQSEPSTSTNQTLRFKIQVAGTTVLIVVSSDQKMLEAGFSKFAGASNFHP
jgi:hypothetical protein